MSRTVAISGVFVICVTGALAAAAEEPVEELTAELTEELVKAETKLTAAQLRHGIKQKLVDLLTAARSDPARHGPRFVRELLRDHDLRHDRVALVYRWLAAADPRLDRLVGKVFPVKLEVELSGGDLPAELATRYTDELTIEARKLGWTLSKTAKGRLQLLQSIAISTAGPIRGTSMNSVQARGNLRLLGPGMELVFAAGVNAAAVHISPEVAAPQAATKLARAAVNELMKYFLEEYAREQ